MTIVLVFIGLFFHIDIPPKWIECNRKEGTITIWSSPKKHKLLGKRHIDDIEFKMARRFVMVGK